VIGAFDLEPDFDFDFERERKSGPSEAAVGKDGRVNRK
jgi:hypothetical protein